jgi:hypothetical protein
MSKGICDGKKRNPGLAAQIYTKTHVSGNSKQTDKEGNKKKWRKTYSGGVRMCPSQSH